MWIVFILSIVLLSISYSTRKGTMSPGVVFYALWTFIIGLYLIDKGQLIAVSTLIPIILFLGLISWQVGVAIANRSSLSSSYQNKYTPRIDSTLMYKGGLIVMIYIMFIAAMRSLPFLLAGGTLGEVRYAMREDILGNLTVWYVYIAEPMALVVIHYNMLRIMRKRDIKKSALSILLTLILSELCIGGRFMFYYVAWDAVFVFFYANKNSDLLIRNKKKIRVVFIITLSILLTAFVLVTGVDKVWSTIYSYSCGCLKLMDLKINDFHGQWSYTFGFTSINGFTRPIATLLRAITGIPLPSLISQAEDILLNVEQADIISKDGGYYNGFVSLFYSFYVDGGIIGVILLSMLWGYGCQRIYLRLINRGSDRDVLLYMLILQALAMSMTRFAFVTYQYALAFVYVYLLFPRKSIKILEHNENSSSLA